MAVCLIKSILFAMLSVFVVMPGLLMLSTLSMDKTKHRNFVPEIPSWAALHGTRKVIPVIFLWPSSSVTTSRTFVPTPTATMSSRCRR